MLHHLVEYAQSHSLNPRRGFATIQVGWLLSLDRKGHFLGVVDIAEKQGKRRVPRSFFDAPDEITEPSLFGGTRSTSWAQFLTDSAATLAIFDPKKPEARSDTDKDRRKHEFFLLLLDWAGRESGDELFLIAAAALRDELVLAAIRSAFLERKVKTTDKLTLQVDGQILIELKSWHPWWAARFAAPVAQGGEGASGRQPEVCLLTGELAVPPNVHGKIKGLASTGGQPVGDSLVCADKAAFSCYGLAAAAVSPEAEVAYRASLNQLLRQGGEPLGNAKLAYWYTGSVAREDDPLSWLEDPSGAAERIALRSLHELLDSIRTGRQTELDGNRYRALRLSGMAGRVMVRDWLEGDLASLFEQVHSWFQDLAIVAPQGTELAAPPRIGTLGASLVREKKDLAPPLVTKLWRSAIAGEAIPYATVAMAVRRQTLDIVTDNNPGIYTLTARMGLLRAYHVRKPNGDRTMTPKLNPEHPDAAYHCGRLLAVLASLQRSALGDVGAGVVQRFYSSASQTPALVVGRLLANAPHHLAKLDGGLANMFELRIAEVLNAISELPRTLELERQSLFALGYYHQKAHDFAQMTAAREAKANSAATSIELS
ncbi:MAG: type I-C CRISPR-associated protein Cas8c/Csd1 [Myxococcota bacterium]|jgi:CRISPR-associated protein Csd1|nr:type I-C CRISPR-associated protein Cas8c/Csd1 [Myxococcota bacterium]